MDDRDTEMEDRPLDGALDPDETPRQYYRHQYTGTQREIWRPGDGDGDRGTDYYDRIGPVLPLEKRWRLFQTDLGEIGSTKATPPKFVFLDDRAVYDIMQSDIPKAKLTQWWPHDFGQGAKVRVKRTHIGRPAIKDENGTGNDRYHSVAVGGKGMSPYYFTGEKDYKPIVYQIKAPPPPTEEELSRKRRAESPEESNPRAHGHNQYTPKDQLVKYGAPSKRKPRERLHNMPPLPRPNTPFLSGSENPIHVERRLYGGIEQNARESVIREANKAAARGGNMYALAQETRIGAEDSDIGSDGPSTTTRSASAAGQPFDAARAPPPVLEPGLEHIEVPRDMGYLERRDVERRITNQVLRGIQTDADVQRLAGEMAAEKIQVAQQEKEIGRLRKQLDESQEEVEQLKQVVDQAAEESNALEAQVEDRSQEIDQLKEELVKEKRARVRLELKVDEQNEELKKLQNN